MKFAFFYLTLASLLLATVHCDEPNAPSYESFRILHTYNRNEPLDCTQMMNRVLARLKIPCKPCNNVILGDSTDRTQISDVIAICNGQGTSVGHNLFRSNKSFRTMKCIKQGGHALPPDCQYTGRSQYGQVTVGCSQGYPVHFEGC